MWYLGKLADGKYEVFQSSTPPTPKMVPFYKAAIGPFTKESDARAHFGSMKVGTRILLNPNMGEVDATSARELRLFIDNNSTLYKRMHEPIMADLRRKIAKGTYDHDKAARLFLYEVDEGARLYNKEFGDGTRSLKLFNKSTREAVAREMRDHFETEEDLQKNPLSAQKARTILAHGVVRGKKLTEGQRRLLGAVASGQKMKANPRVPPLQRMSITHRRCQENPAIILRPEDQGLTTAQLLKKLSVEIGWYKKQGLEKRALALKKYQEKIRKEFLRLKRQMQHNPALTIIGNPRTKALPHTFVAVPGGWQISDTIRLFEPIFKTQREALVWLKSQQAQTNPPTGIIMSDNVIEIRYIHRGDGQAYKHTFEQAGTRMIAEKDGTIRIYHPEHRIHEDFPE